MASLIEPASRILDVHDQELGSGVRSVGLLLIKPSHYDDDGFVIQWWRSFMISNVLIVVDGLFAEAADRWALGPDIRIETRRIDEMSNRLRPDELMRWLDGFDRCAVMMVGVQTNQFPRAVDIARPFREAGYPVIIGGFHVSGVLAMVPEWEGAFPGVKELGISLFAGELEAGVDALLRDIRDGAVKPLYNNLTQVADLSKAPALIAAPDVAARTLDNFHGMEVGRGCPFICSFCTIINVHGHAMRCRSPEAIETYLRGVAAVGGHSILISDDNFARSPIWREVTEILIRLSRELDWEWDVLVQVDTLASRIPGFVEACREAGVKRIFLGMESVREDNLKAAAKGQNKLHLMRDMVLTWKRAGIMIYAGVIIGFPNDTPERVREDIRFLQDEIPVDIVTFFALSPLPGSKDHQLMLRGGVPIDEDLNAFDTIHVITDHPLMTRTEWQALFQESWRQYYTLRHMWTVVGRGLYYGLSMKNLCSTFAAGYGSAVIEGVHPLDYGAIRQYDAPSRRPGYPALPRPVHEVRYTAKSLLGAASALMLVYIAFAMAGILSLARPFGLLKRFSLDDRVAAPVPGAAVEPAQQTAAE